MSPRERLSGDGLGWVAIWLDWPTSPQCPCHPRPSLGSEPCSERGWCWAGKGLNVCRSLGPHACLAARHSPPPPVSPAEPCPVAVVPP